MSGFEPKLLTDGYRTKPWPGPGPAPGPGNPPRTFSSVVPPASRAAGGSAPAPEQEPAAVLQQPPAMSGAASFAPRRARFQSLHVKLVSLRQVEEVILTEDPESSRADDARVRLMEVIDRLCALVTVMRAEGDFGLIDDLLAKAEDASCR